MCVGVFLAQLSVFGSAYALSSGGILAISNNHRAAAGLPALAYNSQLTAAANAKAAHMCTYNYWDHTAPDGTTGWTFISRSGYAYIRAGENLAKGFSTDQAVVDGWMASAGHRANILQPAFVDTGIGSYQCGASVYDTIVVAMYAVRNAPAPVVAPAPVPKPASPTSVPKTAVSAPAKVSAPSTAPSVAPSPTSITVTAVVLPAPSKKILEVNSLIGHELTDDAYTVQSQTFMYEELVVTY